MRRTSWRLSCSCRGRPTRTWNRPSRPDQADDGSDGVNQLGAGVEIRGDHVGGFRNAADTVTLGESPTVANSMKAAERIFSCVENFNW